MLRTVDISEYWRTIIKENEEFKNIAIAENPEFRLLWLAMERVLNNQFIDTMDEYGISKWEKFLKTTPFSTDTLAIRRDRVKALLLGDLPYTMRSLIAKLKNICNSDNVKVDYYKPDFLLEIKIPVEAENQRMAVKTLVKRIVPANIIFNLIQEFEPLINDLKIKPHLGGSVFIKLPLGIQGGYEVISIKANLGGYKFTEIPLAEIKEA